MIYMPALDKHSHRHLSRLTHFFSFFFLTVLVCVGGVSALITAHLVSAQAGVTPPGSDTSGPTNTCTSIYALAGTNQCNYSQCPTGCRYENECPVGCQPECSSGMHLCPGHGCYPADTPCPTESNTNQTGDDCPAGYFRCSSGECRLIGTSCEQQPAPNTNTNSNTAPLPTCESPVSQNNTTQCNYSMCADGCYYNPINSCPIGCINASYCAQQDRQFCPGVGCRALGIPCPGTSTNTNSADNTNTESQPSCSSGYTYCPGVGCRPSGLPCTNTAAENNNQNTNTAGNTNTNSAPPAPQYTFMLGVVQTINTTARQLTLVNNETGVPWNVITTDATLYSGGGEQTSFATIRVNQSVKVYYHIYFEDERRLVARGIQILSFSPAPDTTTSTPVPSTNTNHAPAVTPPRNSAPSSVGNSNSLQPNTTPLNNGSPTNTPPPQLPRDPARPAAKPINTPTNQGLPQNLSDSDRSRFLGYCRQYNVSEPGACLRLISENLDPVCRTAGVMNPESCDQLLREKHLNEFCKTTGAATSAECRQMIREDHRGEIRCGDLDETACETKVETEFVGHIARGIATRTAVENALQKSPEPTRISIPAFTDELQKDGISPTTIPVRLDSTQSYSVIPSKNVIDVSSGVMPSVSIPYVLIADTDGDGLGDDLEKLYATDADNPDTDGDGFSDADELRSDHNPLSDGGNTLERILSETEHALINVQPLDQPTFGGTTDPAFTIEPVAETGETKGMTLRGRAQPNTVVLVYIYSKLPMVLTVKTDESGNWIYDLQESLTEDRHTVYVAVTDTTGRITKKSNPLSFVVRPVVAATQTTFLTDEQVPRTQSSTNFALYYLIGGFILIATALALVILGIFKRINRNA